MAKIRIVCPSRPKQPYRDAIAELAKRAGVETNFVKEVEKHLKGRVILLDEQGQLLNTNAFSELVKKDMSTDLTFVVGGPDGIDVKHDQSISLGKLTLNHQLTILVLLDQLFRVLKPNHPYNKH
ncbi:MAG: 23S rRNA (pseudouridine(1915)-N(3))-methyltransferase RlmH [Candidatus Altiarchaeota archaeon]|nr:23S rRNA (pseudouridine(1915)-N(3))-methyltransferase RlmH [Candidatus Altiarchaeota archaeon]